ncbi:hypothetical protein CFC21_047791 [Triticum aestivum]|uniref:Myb-like domain-containing protein n=2 Tax=Triticum aestivum TaxID=4565 RepID=A0A3B6U6G6_WHEAT|nr:uncharacterized protein LOC123100753 isoform X3 [Triticum aestivum]KAF7037423.1 hypothetical protein CFC21_047791 [Triticum aestivum]
MGALGPDIHQLYLQLQLLSGQDASKAQPPFFHPTPTPPPHAPGSSSSYVAAAHGPVDDFVYGLVPGAGNGTLAPGEGSPMLGHSAFLENDQFVDGLEDPLALMSGDELSAFLSDEAGGVPPEFLPDFLARSLAACQTAMADSPPVPPAGVPSRSSSGSPGLGCAQARPTDDSPAGGLEEPLTRMSGDDDLSAFLSDEAGVNSLSMPPEYPIRSLLVYQPAMADSPPAPTAAVPSQSSSGSPGQGCAQARATDSPVGGAYQPVPDYSQAASLDAPQQEPDSETAEVARMAHVAARCGDKPSTAWSVEEDQLLFRGLSRFAGQDNVIQCLNIASGLAEKTALDVAYRIRWLSGLKKKNLGQEKSAVANVTKGKGTKVANKKNNKHPLSKEALDSRSVKDIIRDNNRLMDKIEEILRTGEVNNCPDYFYYVKMNMDAMQNKVKDLASVMLGLAVGDEEWEDVLKDRHDTPQAGEDAATTPAP